MSAAGGPKGRRRGLEKEQLGELWEGKVDAAVELLQGALEWVRNPKAVADLSAYLKKRRASLPDYQQRQRAGLWIASTRVEKFLLVTLFGEGSGCLYESGGGSAILAGSAILPRGHPQGGRHAGRRALVPARSGPEDDLHSLLAGAV